MLFKRFYRWFDKQKEPERFFIFMAFMTPLAIGMGNECWGKWFMLLCLGIIADRCYYMGWFKF